MADLTEESVLAPSAHEEGYDPVEDWLRATVRRSVGGPSTGRLS